MSLWKAFDIVILTVSFSGMLWADKKSYSSEEAITDNPPQVGEKAPDFTLPYATQDTIVFQGGIKLSEQFGKGPIVLAFYPADWSGGCTKEMCLFRDRFADLQKLEAQILAISGDYVFSHHEWAKRHNLPFALLSSHDGTVPKLYGSWNDVYDLCKRTVFLLDDRGIIRYRDLAYNAHDEVSFEALKEALTKLKS